jgi:hypothetical protein
MLTVTAASSGGGLGSGGGFAREDFSAGDEAELRSALAAGLRHCSAPSLTPVVFTLPSGEIALGTMIGTLFAIHSLMITMIPRDPIHSLQLLLKSSDLLFHTPSELKSSPTEPEPVFQNADALYDLRFMQAVAAAAEAEAEAAAVEAAAGGVGSWGYRLSMTPCAP